MATRLFFLISIAGGKEGGGGGGGEDSVGLSLRWMSELRRFRECMDDAWYVVCRRTAWKSG